MIICESMPLWLILLKLYCQKKALGSLGIRFVHASLFIIISKNKNRYAMTLVKFHQKPFERTLNTLFEDLFQQLPGRLGTDDWGSAWQSGRTPVNIRESQKSWALDVVAPGFDRSDFRINLEKNILTISAERQEEDKQEDEKHVRKEYSFRSFSRSFTVDERIDASSITAKYENGVLLVDLPKKEEPKAQPHRIAVQ